MPMTDPDLVDRLHLIRDEYLEVPALSLTAVGAQKLWGLDTSALDVVLATLVNVGVLTRTARGTYVRADRG